MPRPPEGNRFKRRWFEVVDELPKDCSFVRWWDKAATDGAGDYTAGVLLARANDQTHYIVDVVRGQWSPFRREQIMEQTAAADEERHGHVRIWHEQEPGSAGKESAEATTKNLCGYTVSSEPSTGDKVVRAEPFAAQCEAGNVKLLRGSWNEVYIDELTSFPSGAHDDQVDASAAAFSKVIGGEPAWGIVLEEPRRRIAGWRRGAERRSTWRRDNPPVH